MISYLAILAFILVAYFIYTKGIRMFIKKRYYESQGARFIRGEVPVLGHLLRFKQILEGAPTNDHPWHTSVVEDFGTGKLPKVIGMFNSFEPCLFVTDPKMINEMYVSKNKFFDKHDGVYNALYTLMGDTMLFQ